jgi:hypothetical protein
MKLILILSAGLLLFTVPAFSELTVEDLEKIRNCQGGSHRIRKGTESRNRCY